MSVWTWPNEPDAHETLPPTRDEEAVPVCVDCQTLCDASMPCRCCQTARAEVIAALDGGDE